MEKKSRLLVLVLASNRHPYDRLLLDGQTPTWIDHSRRLGVPTIPYLGSLAGSIPGNKEFNIRFRFEHMVSLFGLNRVRRVHKEPKYLSRKFRSQSYPEAQLSNDETSIMSSIPDHLSTVGLRTLDAMRVVANHFEFDYLVRTNSSSYIDVKSLSEFLPEKAMAGSVFGLHGTWGRISYPSGALYVISRSDLLEVISNSHLWQHEYIDDVALGLLLHKLNPSIQYIDIPRFDFPFNSKETVQSDLQFQPAIHFRCKSDDWRESVRRMHEVHSRFSVAD